MSKTIKSESSQCCWIDTVDPADASAELNVVYQQVNSTHGKVHNLYRSASLQPKPILSADQHYSDILHNEKNESAPWFLELLSSQVAIIANCDYALINHGANFKALLGDEKKAKRMLKAVREDNFDQPALFTEKHSALLKYGAKLSRSPESMCERDIENLRHAGASDTEILEAVQATACFAYWVRYINALGIQIGDEPIGKYNHGTNN